MGPSSRSRWYVLLALLVERALLGAIGQGHPLDLYLRSQQTTATAAPARSPGGAEPFGGYRSGQGAVHCAIPARFPTIDCEPVRQHALGPGLPLHRAIMLAGRLPGSPGIYDAVGHRIAPINVVTIEWRFGSLVAVSREAGGQAG